MPETQSTIEHDIAELEQRLQEKKSLLEQQAGQKGEPVPHEKEILKEVVGEKIQKHIPQYQPPLPTAQAPTVKAVEPPSYLSQELKDKIQALVQLVFDKNLEEGIKEAAKPHNAALLDAFHDILVDELYNQLIEKRKLKRVE